MQLVPTLQMLEENEAFANNALCESSLGPTINFYKRVGFAPWISYYVTQNGVIVAGAGFKGKPVNGTVEIAYGTFEQYQHQGIGAAVCKLLLDLNLQTDAAIKITAKTMPEKSFSTKILEKNNFACNGIVIDLEDGEVWEWGFAGS